MSRYAVYGAQGFGREVMPLVVAQAREEHGTGPVDAVFVDDDPHHAGGVINGHPVISFADLCQAAHADRLVSIAIGAPQVRAKVVEQCQHHGFQFLTVQAADHIAYDEVEVGTGAIFCAHSMVTSNARIGCHFHCNIYAYVAHDCVIGDFVTFAPRVNCNGRVLIDDFAYIGTAAVLRQGAHDKPLRIGRGATVGMGAVVTKDVPAGVTVVGNPARPLERGSQ